jgi:hypothetical protein
VEVIRVRGGVDPVDVVGVDVEVGGLVPPTLVDGEALVHV